MILDGFNLIYVWIGNGANREERDAAENIAKVIKLHTTNIFILLYL